MMETIGKARRLMGVLLCFVLLLSCVTVFAFAESAGAGGTEAQEGSVPIITVDDPVMEIIGDEDTPLAGPAPAQAHTCVLHVVLLIAAALVFAATVILDRRQRARIARLRRELEGE